MPEEGVQLSPSDDLLTTPEILKLARLFVGQGVSKIRLTGGEPTVRKDIIQLVQQLGDLRQDGLKEIAMTSNGIALNRKLPALIDAGLTHLNLSLDTLDPFKYQLISRKNGANTQTLETTKLLGLSHVLRSIDQALNLGIHPLKINCVVIKNLNDNEILDFVDMTKDKPLHVRFIEYMPFDGNQWKTEKMVSYQSMLSIIRQQHPSLHKDSDDMNDTSKTYKINGHTGRIGFITSMTHKFCGTCNRLRLTSDGNLKVCLFGNAEVSLRDMIRSGCSDNEMLEVIGMAVKRKKKEHAGIGMLENMKNRPMILIGNMTMKPNGSRLLPWTNTLSSISTLGLRVHSTSSKKKDLTHLDENGAVHMVAITSKSPTNRLSIAKGKVIFSDPVVADLIRSNLINKGDVLATARVAGIMASKRTADIIPLCHNITLSSVSVCLFLQDKCVDVEASVECQGATGVEMEALTAVTAACLTVYDMCKAVDKNMHISDIKVIKKVGGKSGDWSVRE
ncbi:Molybdenum cofactor biosynthesis protein 1 [Neolecta irregularis DAH-3]|uniref:cyclic pyranopterin monophosphate synthase n=1 Tax=Neolecta irregularis (strain DAH-3) TaxID=1198029 RepID=A0A1U7LIM5_NEOID|nr:Molybdenum cofactor biosynthesis protein 1 [Neolecta irregularis DAH-3]|eukprot:OLL22510.1 Molybdenum cofactor biosynthesis protein 1 [Neolecta irregularis DAH-3]